MFRVKLFVIRPEVFEIGIEFFLPFNTALERFHQIHNTLMVHRPILFQLRDLVSVTSVKLLGLSDTLSGGFLERLNSLQIFLLRFPKFRELVLVARSDFLNLGGLRNFTIFQILDGRLLIMLPKRPQRIDLILVSLAKSVNLSEMICTMLLQFAHGLLIFLIELLESQDLTFVPFIKLVKILGVLVEFLGYVLKFEPERISEDYTRVY